MFPETYLSPRGDRISFICALTCDIDGYVLDPETRLAIYSTFLVEDTTRQPDWIAIDQGIRSLVFQWMKDR